ncbi:DUF3306 domain-containing protein [Rivibacter subsaxonicus]|uniref:Uncharacterized protein DUF3306 n=1 Tax=Rivibacter subsaxonicus TaxID=457575 RepID=A0A4Q7VMW2_9BURK|nr:DUF3306 domain-containing protein [Rivibacter subsaxonicus]RZT97629.1 uncharacterized protein DUF3306 [Rivibacter subsaxonicus]
MTAPERESDPADGGFFSRWSRRKAEQRREEPAVVPAVVPPVAGATPAPVAVEPAALPAALPAAEQAPPAPTLEDVALLAPGDEVSRFIKPGVDAGVQRAALKKLFADPHFNVMDGLDTYIDDYGKPDPIPESMLRQMNQSKFLRLFEEDEEKPVQQPVTAVAPATAPDAAPVSSSEVEATAPVDGPANTPPDEDPDLQLQPDDPDRRPGAPEGTG